MTQTDKTMIYIILAIIALIILMIIILWKDIKAALRATINEFLGTRSLIGDIVKLRKENKQLREDLSSFGAHLRIMQSDIKNNRSGLEVVGRTLRTISHVGIDMAAHETRDHSWMVVCLRRGDNNEIVKFYNLDGYNHRQVLDIVKMFEGSNKVQDYPYSAQKFEQNIPKRL